MAADDLAGLSLRELLARLADATPAPGGGSAAAVACGLAAGLVEMAAGFAPRSETVMARAASLRGRALELADAELRSYAPVLEALRRPASDPERAQRLDEALAIAAVTPLQIAATGAELAELAAQTARECSPHLSGDAITAAVLADGACCAASRLVEINLSSHAGDPRRAQAAQFAREAAASREVALSADTGTRSR